MTATYKTIGGTEVNIPNIDVHVSLPELKDVLQQAISPPKIDIHVPEQELVAPVVHVHVPEYPKPEIHVQAPEVKVESPANVVNVELPEQQPPQVIINPQQINVYPPAINIQVQPVLTQKVFITTMIGAYLLLLVMIILMFTAHPSFSWLHR